MVKPLSRKEGMTQRRATSVLEGKGVAFKNELLFQKGINYNDLPTWQKRGIGLYFKNVQKTGYDPIKKEETIAERRIIFTEYELPTGDEYRDMLMKIMKEA